MAGHIGQWQIFFGPEFGGAAVAGFGGQGQSHGGSSDVAGSAGHAILHTPIQFAGRGGHVFVAVGQQHGHITP